jgi:anti-sigma B factor antagonist
MDVTVKSISGAPLLEAKGEIDHSSCGALQTALDEALYVGNDHVLIDLRQVTYIDSGGLSVLLSGVRRLRDRGWLGVIGPNTNVKRLLEIVGLLVDSSFRVFDSPDSVEEALSQSATR